MRSIGIGAPFVSAHSRRELERRHDPLRLAGAIGLLGDVGQPLGRVRIAAPDRELGEHGLARAAGDGLLAAPISPRTIRSASSHSPARSRSQAIIVARYDARVCTSCAARVGERPARA